MWWERKIIATCWAVNISNSPDYLVWGFREPNLSLFSFCQYNTNHEYHSNISIAMASLPYHIYCPVSILSHDNHHITMWNSYPHFEHENLSFFLFQQSEFKFQIRIQANQKRLLFLWMYFKLYGHIHIWIWIYCFYTYCKQNKSSSQVWYDRVATVAGTWLLWMSDFVKNLHFSRIWMSVRKFFGGMLLPQFWCHRPFT